MSLRPCAYPVASLGYLVGTALQLMQTALWGRHVYLAWMTGALIAWVWAMAGLGPGLSHLNFCCKLRKG